jgi:mRNA interferase HigB
LRIVTFARIQNFGSKYPDADIALRDWYTKVKQYNWETLNDVKDSFNHADSVVNNRIFFDIKGNKYRLVAIVIYASQKVYIRFIGTHKQYDKIDCTTI